MRRQTAEKDLQDLWSGKLKINPNPITIGKGGAGPAQKVYYTRGSIPEAPNPRFNAARANCLACYYLRAELGCTCPERATDGLTKKGT